MRAGGAMKNCWITLGFLLGLSSAACAQSLPTVVIKTQLGDITVELDRERAPRTVDNFLHYVDGKFYDGGGFHRTVTLQNQSDNPVKIEVVQARISSKRESEQLPPIALERTSITGLRHRTGTLSMARGEPDSATSSFFICVTDQPELDFGGKRNPDGQGFAAFGRVIRGMEVVRAIQRSRAHGQDLTPLISITSVRRIGKDRSASGVQSRYRPS
jgi:peptidyl-prolyl cis-trans isomerase A (cyclophilin A)